MHLMVVYRVSRWFFNRFLFGYQETGVFCGHFQFLELLWTNYCGFIFLFYHFLLSKRCCGGGGTCDDELRQCFLMLPHTNEVDRSPCTSLAEKGEWLLLLSPSNKRLQNCHWVRLIRFLCTRTWPFIGFGFRVYLRGGFLKPTSVFGITTRKKLNKNLELLWMIS